MAAQTPTDVELIKRYQSGEAGALDILLERYKGWAIEQANSYRSRCNSRISQSDLLQVVYLAMINAASHFDEGAASKIAGNVFLAYATQWLRAEMKAFLSTESFDFKVERKIDGISSLTVLFKGARAVTEIEQKTPGITRSEARSLAAKALGVSGGAIEKAVHLLEIGDAAALPIDDVDVAAQQQNAEEVVAGQEIENEFSTALLEAIMALPPRQRLCVTMISLEGKANAAPAELLGVTPQRAGQLANQGLASIISSLQQTIPDLLADAAGCADKIASRMRAQQWADKVMASIDMTALAR